MTLRLRPPLANEPPSTVTLRAGDVFEWQAGVRLTAIETSRFAFPPGVWCEGERFGSVLEASSDDVDIGIQKTDEGSITSIQVILKAGESLLMHRNSEAVLVAEGEDQRSFAIQRDE